MTIALVARTAPTAGTAVDRRGFLYDLRNPRLPLMNRGASREKKNHEEQNSPAEPRKKFFNGTPHLSMSKWASTLVARARSSSQTPRTDN